MENKSFLRPRRLRIGPSHFGRPRGQAAVEYALIASGVALVWLAIERSPEGLAHAFFRLLSQYKFLMSIPW
jgi:hypothetical protein